VISTVIMPMVAAIPVTAGKLPVAPAKAPVPPVIVNVAAPITPPPEGTTMAVGMENVPLSVFGAIVIRNVPTAVGFPTITEPFAVKVP
jgi:hypothetical protein